MDELAEACAPQEKSPPTPEQVREERRRLALNMAQSHAYHVMEATKCVEPFDHVIQNAGRILIFLESGI